MVAQYYLRIIYTILVAHIEGLMVEGDQASRVREVQAGRRQRYPSLLRRRHPYGAVADADGG